MMIRTFRRAVGALARPIAIAAMLMSVSRALDAQGAEPLRFTLQQAIARATEQGLTASAARATRDAARQRDRAFGAGLMPQLVLTGNVPSYNRSIVPVFDPAQDVTVYRPQEQNESALTMNLSQRLPFVGGDLFVSSGLSRLDALRASAQAWNRTYSSTPLTVGIRQDLFRPNRLKWDARQQDLRAESAERTYREAMEEVAIATANTFFDYYTAKLALENAATNAAVNDTLFSLNKGRFDVGKIGENDLLQSELALLRARVALDGARLEHDRTLAALRLALNLATGAAVEVIVTNEIPEVEADTALAVAQAMRNRASMVDLEMQQVQAERTVAEARFGTGPGATLNASMGFNQTAGVLDSAYRDLHDAQRFNLSVSMPLVQWGGRGANIQAARLDGQRVERTSRQAREQLALDAHFAALGLAQARRSLAIAAKADTVGSKRFEVTKNRYVIGRIGMDNLYQAQSEKDAALLAYLQALRGYWVAHYRLRRVTMYDFVAGVTIR